MTAPTLADEMATFQRTLDKLRDFIREHPDPGADAFACVHEAELSLARLEAMPEERERCAAIADAVHHSHVIRGRSYGECWREACREIADRIRALPSPTERRRCWYALTRWRHRKRGSSYEILTSTAEAQCSTGPINEGDHVTVYQANNGSWWVRKTAEFQDGRFERIDALPPEPQEGER